MTEYGQAQMCKIPLRSFPNAVIEHDLVTIRLRMDWVEKDGTDPSILIYITSKYPTNGCFPRNQSSVMVNSVHHHHPHPHPHPHPHQDGLPSTHPQPYYHSSSMGSYEPPNVTTINTAADHTDISSMTTTTTVVYNSGRPQHQTPASLLAIEKIASYLKSQVPSSLSCQSGMDPSNTSLQDMQTPANNINDSQLDIDMFGINSISTMKDTSCVMDPNIDFSQQMDTPSPLSSSSHLRSLVCNCPNPMQNHIPDCAINLRNNLDPNIDFFSESSHESPVHPMSNQDMDSFLQMPISGVTSLPPITELANPSSSVPFHHSNPFRMMDSSSNTVTAILSQPSFLFDHSFMNSTNDPPPMHPINHFQQYPIDMPPMFFNNQSNYINTTTMPLLPMKKSKTIPKTTRVRKKSVKRTSASTSDQSPAPTASKRCS